MITIKLLTITYPYSSIIKQQSLTIELPGEHRHIRKNRKGNKKR